MVLGIMEFAIAVLAYNSIANAEREGARYGIIHPGDTAGIVDTVRAAAVGLDQAAFQFNVSQPVDAVQVEVIYDHGLLTGPLVQAVGGSPTLQLHTVATMRAE